MMVLSSFLRFAPHLGYLGPENPLFLDSVGSARPEDHVAFASSHGFAGIFDPWMASRPIDEIDLIIRGLQEYDLQCGALAYAPLSAMFTPLFARAGHMAWQEIEEHLRHALDLSQRTGSEIIAIVLQGTAEMPLADQRRTAAAHLRAAGDLVAAAGRRIGIEPMVALPNLMLSTTAETIAFLEEVNHPAVQMMFDTGHVHEMDGDIQAAWTLARDRVCSIQLVDMPGRIAPGTGTLPLAAFLAQAVRDGKAHGVIELEHGWSNPSAVAEREGMSALAELDSEVRTLVAGAKQSEPLNGRSPVR